MWMVVLYSTQCVSDIRSLVLFLIFRLLKHMKIDWFELFLFFKTKNFILLFSFQLCSSSSSRFYRHERSNTSFLRDQGREHFWLWWRLFIISSFVSPLKEIGAPRSQFINKVEPSLPSGGENLQGDRRIAQQQQQQQQHRKELKAKRLRSSSMFLDGLIYPEREIRRERERGEIFWYHPLVSICKKNLFKKKNGTSTMQLCWWKKRFNNTHISI